MVYGSTGRLMQRVRVQRLPFWKYLHKASPDVVIPRGTSLLCFKVYLKLPGRKDARTSEKPLLVPPQTPFIQV